MSLHKFELRGNHGFIAPGPHPLGQIQRELLDLIQIRVLREVERHPEKARQNFIRKALPAIWPGWPAG